MVSVGPLWKLHDYSLGLTFFSSKCSFASGGPSHFTNAQGHCKTH